LVIIFKTLFLPEDDFLMRIAFSPRTFLIRELFTEKGCSTRREALVVLGKKCQAFFVRNISPCSPSEASAVIIFD
jgi:hypothetical protein